LRKIESEDERELVNSKLDYLERMTRKLKETSIQDVEHCILNEYHKHDVELKVNLLMMCP